MKQFIGCLFFTIFFHILASFIGGSFNPMEWTDTGGKSVYAIIQIWIWLAPILMNYLNGDKNF